MIVNRRERDFFAAGPAETGTGRKKPYSIGISRGILSFYRLYGREWWGNHGKMARNEIDGWSWY